MLIEREVEIHQTIFTLLLIVRLVLLQIQWQRVIFWTPERTQIENASVLSKNRDENCFDCVGKYGIRLANRAWIDVFLGKIRVGHHLSVRIRLRCRRYWILDGLIY